MGVAKNAVFKGFVSCLIGTLLAYLSPIPYAYANPVGGNVSAGSATISTSGNTETITQKSQNAVHRLERLQHWRQGDDQVRRSEQFLSHGKPGSRYEPVPDSRYAIGQRQYRSHQTRTGCSSAKARRWM